MCGLPATAPWRNVALAHARPGRWHDAHAAPKCRAGAAWHEPHAREDGCVCAHDTPGLVWHDAHAAGYARCVTRWQPAHASEPVCRNEADAKGVAGEWQVAQAAPKCRAGAA